MEKKLAAQVVDWVTSQWRSGFLNHHIPLWFGQHPHPHRLPVYDSAQDSARLVQEVNRLLAEDRRDLALSAVRKLMVIDHERAYYLLSRILLSNTDYLQVLKHLHAVLTPANYLEIGVRFGTSIALAHANTQAVGVDPVLNRKCRNLPHHIRLFTMTSDDFFATMDLTAIFAGRPLEMAFIDGMHLFEFTLRDFIHTESLCHPGATILLHDTYPVDPVVATRKQLTGFWTGDVWKILPCLKKYRPDLRIHTIATGPSGLTIVRNLDPGNRVLQENLQEIYAEFIFRDFSEYQTNIHEEVNLFPMDPDRISREILGSA